MLILMLSLKYFLLKKTLLLSCPQKPSSLLCKQPGISVGLLCSSVGKELACNAGDPGSIPRSGRSPGEKTGYPLQYSWTSFVAQLVKNPPAMWETWVRSLGWECSLEKGKAIPRLSNTFHFRCNIFHPTTEQRFHFRCNIFHFRCNIFPLPVFVGFQVQL